MGSLTLAGCVYLLRLRLWLPAAIWSSAIFDSLKIIGYLPFSDYSPIYFNNVGAFATLILVAGYHGGFATISMAGLAYRRFRRDIVLNEIQNSIETSNEQDICARFSDLKNVLPDITQLVGAGKISVTISLPLGRPITQTYDVKSGEAKFFDDGKIPGAVTLRTLVYGDEAMFESFEEFASRLRLPLNSKLADSRYFCAIPLRVNQTIVGTLMLTSFEDEIIRRYKATTNEQMREIQEIIHLIGERLSQSLSKLMVQNMDIITDLSKSLQSSIHQSIAASAGVDEFLQRFVDSIGSVSHLQVMLHEHVHDRGIGLVSAGMEKNHWLFFAEHPFNLSKSAKPAYGPTVVAFRDGKSSYVKDIREIYDKMHSMTQEILSQMNTLSIIAIPLRTAQRSFVVTLLSGRSEAPADPALVAVVEATEALFVAAIEVMSQKTSVLALGQLASRLIGDDEVRTKILKAAKDSELATTIGSPRTSFLLLFDLIGSSELSEDTETKAQAYGRFYDAVNQKCQEVLGGMIRKTIGDAVIVTWDGTGVALDQRCTLLPDLKLVAHYADEIAKSIGCKGSRALLHFGHYFLGLVGTKTFGQIDVIGSGIDEVCKMEGIMKELRIDDLPASLAVSVTAVGQLPNFTAFDFQDSGFVSCSDSGHTKYRIEYAVNLMSLQVKNPYAA
jgi:class 3 adenylate cyclase